MTRPIDIAADHYMPDESLLLKRQSHVVISPRRHRTFTRSLIGLTVLFVGLGAFVWGTGQDQENRQRATLIGPTLAMNPQTATKQTGDTFTVGLTINTGDDTVSASEIHVSYNPQLLEAQSVQADNYLPVVLSPGAINNGTIVIILGSQPTDPKHGSGILATISFRARTSGTSTITYATNTQVASIGKTTNTLAGTTGSQITVTTSGTTTATPTPNLTPTPTTAMGITPTPTPNPADIDGNGGINTVDYTLFMSAWFLNNLDVVDLNDDGRKSAIDYTIFMNGWHEAQ